ncbi:MAG: ATP-binding protein [Cyanobacteria bacterium P01_E01_bin.42]
MTNNNSKDNYYYQAEINAVNRRFFSLKFGIPLIISGWPIVFGFAGAGGVVALSLLGLGGIVGASSGSRHDWKQIRRDKKKLWDLTDESDRDGLVQAFATPQKQPIPSLPQTQPKPATANQSPVTEQSSDRIKFDSTQYGWIEQIKPYFALLIYAVQGSGKSTFIRWLASERQKMGDQIIVIDPHYKYGDWQGLEVIGKGYNWQEIEQFMVKFAREVRTRYETYANQPNPNFECVTLIIEEITNASDHINKKALTRFDGSLNGDIRKIKIKIIKVAHGKTLEMTAGKPGTAGGRDRQYVQLLLKGKIDPDSPDDGISPAFQAVLKLPDCDAIEVDMNPDWKVEPVREDTAEPPRTTGSEAVREAEPVREPVEPVQPLSPEARDRVNFAIDSGQSQNKIASEIFGARKGDNERYRNAVKIIQQMRRDRDYHYASSNGIF